MEYLDILYRRKILSEDEKYMAKALELSVKAEGKTSPNPMVGCVIVKKGAIIGEGYHHRCGELHAERNALKNATQDVSGATMYVTLEPCCHYGKTPPCTEAIIENNIKRVVVGATDNNPLVDNKGIRILREHGIEVTVGVLEDECRRVNEVFFHYITSRTPYVVMKYAMTLDGRIASFTGDSKWITGENARGHVHRLRARYSAIMVGIGTVLADNPMLDCRTMKDSNPIRIVLDSKLRIPYESNIVKTADKIPTIIVTSKETDEEKNIKINNIKGYGADIIAIDTDDTSGYICIDELLNVLGNRGIDSILVEGGQKLHGELLTNQIINKVYTYIAPKLIGGADSMGPIGGHGIELMKNALCLEQSNHTAIGDDILIYGYPNYHKN